MKIKVEILMICYVSAADSIRTLSSYTKMIFIILKRSHEITLRGSCEFTIEIFQHHTYEDNKNMLMIFKISTTCYALFRNFKDIYT